MSKKALVFLAFCFLLVSFDVCAGQQRWWPAGRSRQYRGQGECQLDRLNALEPTNRIECAAGLIESWDNNDDEFQCAGVALVRHTIEPNGLLLPSFTNAAQLIYIVEGTGIQGTVIPGCPETYQSSQQSPFERQEGRRRERFQDQHQKIRHIRHGDVLALPAGVAQWVYNDGNRPLIAVILLDVTNSANQLDVNPRRFFLAGNPEDEHQRGRRQTRYGQHSQPRGEGQQFGYCNNIFCGFDVRILADSFNVDEETARRLQSENDKRNNIVRVEGGLQLLRPPSSRRYEEYGEERERYQYGERRKNGLEETLCTMRLRENIGSPLRADVYTRQAGHISTLNSYNLPILYWLQLSAEKGYLHNNAILVPHYNMNSHSVVYVIRGRAWVQIVNDNGENVFDEELREGQVVLVPQNFAVAKRAESEGFEWISFKTSDNAMITPLAGKTSYLRALPDEVVANAYQISRKEARELKNSRREATIFRSSGGRGGYWPRSERRAEA